VVTMVHWLRMLATLALSLVSAAAVAQQPPKDHWLFMTSDNCVGCHNALVTPKGEDVSIGTDWSASMMANSARDPYWQAAVRREIMDHPLAKEEIQDECSACHMPMARYAAKAAGEKGNVFTHLPFKPNAAHRAALAEDGVSCTMCHQISAENLDTPDAFTAGFKIDETAAPGERDIFGPFEIDRGRQHVMNSASRFVPQQGSHVQSSELCGSCHTLYTKSRGENGEVIAKLPEQMPYLEWAHSDYAETQSCQSCHMPVVQERTPLTSVVGQPRDGFSRHVFRGGNFFMLQMLNRYRNELAVKASPEAFDQAARRTVEHLKSSSAELRLERVRVGNGRLKADVRITNLAGHKLPSAYPSRRVWLRFKVTDQNGNAIFESGRFQPDGSIAGNANDADPRTYEPHYERISKPGQVQIYEGILADSNGRVTTGLLTATHYTKDNRLLPTGFDKTTASEDIAVQGPAFGDTDFAGGGDAVRYVVDLGGVTGPFQVEAELWYQPIAYRWALNLAGYDAFETNRFVRFYKEMASDSAVVLSRTSISDLRR